MYSNRIKELASMIQGFKTITDVGTDHAYLPIYLIKFCGYQAGVASDINKGPLEIAKKNVLSYHLDNNIELVLSDGLSNLDKKTDVLVIAGMGGLLINDIINNGLNKLNNYQYILLQANKDMDKVRLFMQENNYEIIDEKIIYDHDKYYQASLFKLSCNKVNYSDLELKYGPINISKKDELFINYLNHLLEKFEKIEVKNDSINKNIQEILELKK